MTLPPKLDLSSKNEIKCMIYWYSIIRHRNRCHLYFCNIVSIRTYYWHRFFLLVQISWWKFDSLEIAATTGVQLKRTIFSTSSHRNSISCFWKPEYPLVICRNWAFGLLLHRELCLSLQLILFIFTALAVATRGHRGQTDRLTEQ